MKIYRVWATFYDYWYCIDRDGRKGEEKFFTTKEKAEKWIEEHATFCYGYDNNVAKCDYQMPEFKIEEIEVEWPLFLKY